MNKPILTIVVPCFNEEEVLKETSAQLSSVLTLKCLQFTIHYLNI